MGGLFSQCAVLVPLSGFFVGLFPFRYTDPTGHDPQCEVGTSACDAEWGLWRQYEQSEAAWGSWDDFKQGYNNYAQYAENPESYVQDWRTRAGFDTGDRQSVLAKLALAENYSASVLAQEIPSFFDPNYPLEAAYQVNTGETNFAEGMPTIPLIIVVSPNGAAVPVPDGAMGPIPVRSGKGFQYTGGSGGYGMSSKTTSVRIMDPTQPNPPSPGYPNGYASYTNSANQTADPYTGQPVSRSSTLWHIKLDSNLK